jgi:hypothetical protein
MGIDDALKFDQYSVRPAKTGMEVVQLLTNVDLVFAVAMAEVTQEDFEQSIIHTGWVGTCPSWLKNLPVVTLPKGEQLGMDHLDFILESLEGANNG